MKQWNAVVLAGDRGPSDPVASAANVKGKALASVAGVSLLERTISTLLGSVSIADIFVVGPDKAYLDEDQSVVTLLNHANITHIEPAKGPSASALKGVVQSNCYPTLLVTCDLVLLTSNIVDKYCQYMSDVEADFVACAVDYLTINDKLPQLKKTQYRFNQHSVCFANLFSVLTKDGLKAIDYWQDIEKSRKKPIQLICKIDWLSVLNYKIGRLSLDQVADKLSSKVGANLKLATMSIPELAIDIDSAHDYQLMQEYFEKVN